MKNKQQCKRFINNRGSLTLVAVILLLSTTLAAAQLPAWGQGSAQHNGVSFMAQSFSVISFSSECDDGLIRWSDVKAMGQNIEVALRERPVSINIQTAVDKGAELGWQVSDWALQLSEQLMIVTDDLTSQVQRAVRLLFG